MDVDLEKLLQVFEQNSPVKFCTRKRIYELTGGAVAIGTLANEDSRGTGPEGRFYLNGQVCYPFETLIPWLLKRVRHIDGRGGSRKREAA